MSIDERTQNAAGAGGCRVIFSGAAQVYFAAQAVDLRRGCEGLATVVREVLKENERSGSVFVFTNLRRDRIRLLHWDGAGLWMMAKRLAPGTMAWPVVPAGVVKLTLSGAVLEKLFNAAEPVRK